MKCKTYLIFSLVFLILSITPSHTFPQNGNNLSRRNADTSLKLVEALMCEGVKEYAPFNQAFVFSISIGKISCFTTFDDIKKDTYIYHRWFHREKMSMKRGLLIKPPRWSIFSSMQLREADKGPWRVEISDSEGRILRIVRFSITD